MSWSARLRKATTQSPALTIRQATDIIRTSVARRRERARALASTTYSLEQTDLPTFRPLLPTDLGRAITDAEARALATVGAHHVEGRFDLLGSGWVRRPHGMVAEGFRGHRYGPGPAPVVDPDGRWLADMVSSGNVAVAQRLWQLVPEDHEPIDWQVDARSGFRWDARTHHLDVVYGNTPGADIKQPWELGRLQHLPRLVLCASLQGRHGAPETSACLSATRAQMLDFLATNPPGFGANWACPMDVAIRGANLAVTLDLLVSLDLVAADDPLVATVVASLVDHASHVVKHLEWNEAFRSNHYLSNVAGLVVMAAHLTNSPEADTWLAFGWSELVREAELQFLDDGANFEASTSYHRLSSELLVWATAFAVGGDVAVRTAGAVREHLPTRPARQLADLALPSDTMTQMLRRLGAAADFSRSVTRPDGATSLIGDNDSGRFLTLSPRLVQVAGEARETHLSHAETVDAISGLLGGEVDTVTGACTRHLRQHLPTSGHGRSAGRVTTTAPSATVDKAGLLPEHATRTLRIEADPSLVDGLRMTHHRDFGLVVFRSPRLYLTLRAGPVGQAGNGGHAHNDQLAIELVLDGRDWFRDPGTDTYTPDPDLRNAYRSIEAHAAPRAGREPCDLNEGLFRLHDRAHARVRSVGDTVVVATHDGFRSRSARQVRIEADAIVITDVIPDLPTSAPITVRTPDAVPASWCGNLAVARGYGMGTSARTGGQDGR